MCTASSASRTYGRSASASEYTATALIPIWRAVRSTRRAISPRLAISTESSIRPDYWGALQLDDRPAADDSAQGLDRFGIILAGRVEPELLDGCGGAAGV